METVNVTMPVPKESKELADAVGAVVAHFVQGKSITEAAALLPAILVAVDGLNKLPEEVKSALVGSAAGYLVHKVVEALKSQAPVAPVPAPELAPAA